jgi:hypothetical protein
VAGEWQLHACEQEAAREEQQRDCLQDGQPQVQPERLFERRHLPLPLPALPPQQQQQRSCSRSFKTGYNLDEACVRRRYVVPLAWGRVVTPRTMAAYCCLCLEDLNDVDGDGAGVEAAPCGHVFHKCARPPPL